MGGYFSVRFRKRLTTKPSCAAFHKFGFDLRNMHESALQLQTCSSCSAFPRFVGEPGNLANDGPAEQLITPPVAGGGNDGERRRGPCLR